MPKGVHEIIQEDGSTNSPVAQTVLRSAFATRAKSERFGHAQSFTCQRVKTSFCVGRWSYLKVRPMFRRCSLACAVLFAPENSSPESRVFHSRSWLLLFMVSRLL
jgi:hypothetical protein